LPPLRNEHPVPEESLLADNGFLFDIDQDSFERYAPIFVAMTRVFGRSLNSRDLDTGAAPQRLRTGNPSDPRFFGQLPEEVDANVDAKSAETEIQMARESS